MKRLGALVLCLALGSGAAAGQKVYKDDEAAALRCANMIALTGVALGGTDLISPEEQDIMLALAVLILERHVSGTQDQKFEALEQMQNRRSPEATLEDYRKNAQHCLERFPIN